MLSRPPSVVRPLRVALVGCGQIADAHLEEIRRIHSAHLVAVCDEYEDCAWQAAARFDVPSWFTDLGRLLDSVKVDVLHITTPPQSHLAIALAALEHGVHVYVEKPVALNAEDVRTMVGTAVRRDRLLCAGHDQLWDPGWIGFRSRIAKGEVGRVVHVDVFQRYDLSGPFGSRITADPDHWVRLLDGGLLQNAVPHSVYRLASFLPVAEEASVQAVWFHRGADFPTDLHALFRTAGVSAALTFVTGAAPSGSLIRVHGSAGTLELDFATQQIRAAHKSSMPALLERVSKPTADLRHALGDLMFAARRLARGDLRYFAGMGGLFAAFYDAVRAGAPPPVPYEDVVRATDLTDQLFAACHASDEVTCAPS